MDEKMNLSKSRGMKGAYGIAYSNALQELGSRGRRDLDELCERSGATLNGTTIRLSYFGGKVEIQIAEQGEAVFDPADLPLVERILILHYLLSRDSRSAKGNKVAFKNLPGASFYDPTYQKRGPGRIARRFGQDPEAFHRACRVLGWPAAEMGDAACRIRILPRIEGLVVLHAGDEEFPPEANILFDDIIVNFLPLEDVAVLAGLIATRLAKSS